MVRDDERELRTGAVAVYERIPLVRDMVNLTARTFAFGGAALCRFDSGGVRGEGVPIEEGLLERAAVGWCVHGHTALALSVRADGAVLVSEGEEAGESAVVRTREPRGPGTDGLPLLWIISINAETILDSTLQIAAPEIVEQSIRFMGLEPWMVRPAQLAIANVDALSFAFSMFESQVEDLRRQFAFELRHLCQRTMKEHDITGGVDLEWRQDIVLRDSVVRHGPTVKVFALYGIPLTRYARAKLNHARQLAANHLIPQSLAIQAEEWFS